MDESSSEKAPDENPAAPQPMSRRKALLLLGFLVFGVPILQVSIGEALGTTVCILKHRHKHPRDTVAIEATTKMWQPAIGDGWQIILKGTFNASIAAASPDIPVWDIDLFDNDVSTIQTIRDAGKKVICYLSAGSYENWRPDKDLFNPQDIGAPLRGWPGESWLNISSPGVRDIMSKRIKMAADKGCDAVDPDNVDGFQNDNGLGLTSNDTVAFMQWMRNQTSQYNMALGLKNAGDVIPQVIDFVDFSVNEQCVDFGECETFSAFIKAGKPVFNIEYPDGVPNVPSSKVQQICTANGTDKFSIVLKKMDLDEPVQYCNGQKSNNTTGDSDSGSGANSLRLGVTIIWPLALLGSLLVYY